MTVRKVNHASSLVRRRPVHFTQPISASTASTAGGDRRLDSFILNSPSRSLPRGVPANFTWVGGIPPYTIRLREDGKRPQEQVSEIDTTYFVWTPTASVGTQMLLELLDGRGFTLALEMILIARAGSSNNDASVAPILSTISPTPTSTTSSSLVSSLPSVPPSPSPPEGANPLPSTRTFTVETTSTEISLYKVMPSTSASAPQSISTFPISTITAPCPPDKTQSCSPTNQSTTLFGQSGGNTISGVTIAAVIMVFVVLLLWTFPWWRSFLPKRKRGYQNDTEKQDIVERGTRDEPALEFMTEADLQKGQTIATGRWDNPSITAVNPFESSENVFYTSYTDEIFTPSSVETVPVAAQSPELRSEAASRERTSYASVPSDSGTISESDMTTSARLSNLTHKSSRSMLPPSYRSNRTTAYIPHPSYPPFPPPIYAYSQTPQVPNPPPPLVFRRTESLNGGGSAGRRTGSLRSSRRRLFDEFGLSDGSTGGIDGVAEVYQT